MTVESLYMSTVRLFAEQVKVLKLRAHVVREMLDDPRITSKGGYQIIKMEI